MLFFIPSKIESFKKVGLALFIVGIPIFISLAFVQQETPESQVNEQLKKDMDVVKESLKVFSKLSTNQYTRAQASSDYLKLRAAYKQIETYMVFRYPTLDKAINGGPVPSITTDVVILHKDDPTGMQVMEEILADESVPLLALQDHITTIEKCLENAGQNLAIAPLQNWEILEANHMAITRLYTLSLSGFDSPVFQNALPDAKTVLGQIQRDIQLYFGTIEDKKLVADFEKLIENGIAFLTQNPHFETFDHFTFLKEIVLPLQVTIKKMHWNTGFETYDEASSYPRTISSGAHFFAQDYLNPLSTMRGNVQRSVPAQVALGKILFYDPILSADNKRACASCHNPQKAFTDSEVRSIAKDFKGTVKRNSPTLINSAFQANFFADLRSNNLNDQISNVFESHQEFATSDEEIVNKLRQSAEYQFLFESAYSSFEEAITPATIKASLELYVRSLLAMNSKFDRNIRGEANDFTTEEKKGANLFFGKAACATCHFPPHFNGFVPPFYEETEGEIIGVTSTPQSLEIDTDLGRYELFKYSYENADFIKGMFKTPTCRNVTYTAPYMHNGAFKTLEEVVDFYDHGGGAGKGVYIPQQTLASDSLHLDAAEKSAIVAFLHTLSDTSGTVQQPFQLPNHPTLSKRKWGGEY